MGEGRSRLSSVVITAGIHLAVVPVLLGLGYHSAAKKGDSIVAVDLSPASSPPPSAQPEARQQERKLQVTPQQVLTELTSPIQQPLVFDMPDPAPQVMPAAFAEAASPAPPARPSPSSMVTSDALGARMVAGRPPRYPLESRRKKEQGTVELLLVLDVDGAVETISVARSSGHARLDDAALSAVRHWRWEPTVRDGVAVKVKGFVEIPFVLQMA